MTIKNIHELELKDLPDEVISEIVKLAAIGAEVVEYHSNGDVLDRGEIEELIAFNDFDLNSPSASLAMGWMDSL